MAVITTPTDWQRGVLTYDEELNLAVFGGRGAGRTTGALFIAMRHCEKHGHGARVLFIRQMLRSLREVEDNLHFMLASQYGDGLRVNRQDHIFILPGGATIEFSPINDTEDMAKLQGRSFSLVIADEYGNFSPQQMKFVDQLHASLRAGTIPTRFVLLANPGGRGHQSIKSRFIDFMEPGIPGKMMDGLPWVWLPAKSTDNPHNPMNYEQSLFAAAGRDKELWRAWAQGDWNIARGAMFADVINEEIQRFRRDALLAELDADGGRHGLYGFLAGDWGQSAPAVCFACLRVLRPRLIFPRGSLILLDEVTSADPDDRSVGMNWSIGKFSDAISDMCEMNKIPKLGALDDAKGLQPDDTLIKAMGVRGFAFERPMKNRRSGWAAMRELLYNSHEKNGKPGQWISERCAGWWETVPLLPRDPTKAEDVDTRAIDHWGDANRYGAVYEIGEVRYNTAKQTTQKYGVGGPTAPVYY